MFFEKETKKDDIVQKKSAMEENTNIFNLSNDLIRRLSNTIESLGEGEAPGGGWLRPNIPQEHVQSPPDQILSQKGD